MRLEHLPPEELIKRYARERRRVYELRRHLKNTTRLLVLERGWLHNAWKSAADARKELYDERKKPQCTLPTPHTKPTAIIVAFFLGAIIAAIIAKVIWN